MTLEEYVFPARLQRAHLPHRGLLHEQVEDAESSVFIRKSPLFSGLSDQECVRIEAGARRKIFSRHETLFVKEQQVRHVLLIKSGCVKLTQLSTNGSEVILWLIGAGDVIGAMGLTSDGGHTCSARVVAESSAFVWDYSKFESILSDSPGIRSNINQIMSERLVELEERFLEIATEQVARRVALTLVRILKRVGRYSESGIEVALSREELAQMTGTTLFTTSRLISEWEGKGLVFARRGSVVIRDPQRLMQEGDDLE